MSLKKQCFPRRKFPFYLGCTIHSTSKNCFTEHRLEIVLAGPKSILSRQALCLFMPQKLFFHRGKSFQGRQFSCDESDFILTLNIFNSILVPYSNNTALHLSLASHNLLDAIVSDNTSVSIPMEEFTDSTIGRSLREQPVLSFHTHL